MGVSKYTRITLVDKALGGDSGRSNPGPHCHQNSPPLERLGISNAAKQDSEQETKPYALALAIM